MDSVPRWIVWVTALILLVISAIYDMKLHQFEPPLPQYWYWLLVGVIFGESPQGAKIIDKLLNIFKEKR